MMGRESKLNPNGTWQYIEGREDHIDELSYADDLVKVTFNKFRINMNEDMDPRFRSIIGTSTEIKLSSRW